VEKIVAAIHMSSAKSAPCVPLRHALLVRDFGLKGDSHAGDSGKQLSLLSIESIDSQEKCFKFTAGNTGFKPGDYGENLSTSGIVLSGLSVGDRLRVGDTAVLELSKIGRKCFRYCSLYTGAADCAVCREGVFARIITGGEIAVGDEITLL